jgi:electron transfer flavoprotein alpha subunit
VPGSKIVGVLIDPNYQEAEAQSKEVLEAAEKINQRIHIARAGNDGDLEAAFEPLASAQADSLLVCADPFFDTRSERSSDSRPNTEYRLSISFANMPREAA